MKEKVLIIGLGEVGHTLFDIFKESGKFDVYGFDMDKKKMREIVGETRLPKNVDFMHICYPYIRQNEFLKTTLNYINKFNPRLAIIESTVPPGTTMTVYRSSKTPVVHSPIRGRHKTPEIMKKEVLFWKKYVGGITKEATNTARKHFENLGIEVKILRSPVETELAKLFETTYRAWLITCFQEMHRISRFFGADFSEVIDMLEDIHRIRFNKPLHYPDVIGGHCLIPNTELLLKSYDSALLQLVLDSNRKRKQEVKNEDVRKEVERIRRRVKALEKWFAKHVYPVVKQNENGFH